jgi:hypothetical protein
MAELEGELCRLEDQIREIRESAKKCFIAAGVSRKDDIGDGPLGDGRGSSLRAAW